jgi:hypothetical protein
MAWLDEEWNSTSTSFPAKLRFGTLHSLSRLLHSSRTISEKKKSSFFKVSRLSVAGKLALLGNTGKIPKLV